MDQSLTELVPRMLLSMTVVIGLMWLAARMLTKRKNGGGSLTSRKKRSPSESLGVQVLARQNLSKHASVSVVKVGDRVLALGVTDQNVTLLADLETIDLSEDETDAQWTGIPVEVDTNAASGQAWTGLLQQIRDVTTRR